MKQVYGADVKVFFRDTFGLRGIFRDNTTQPYSHLDFKEWKKNPFCSITFNQALYEKNDLMPHAWQTIIHEVTHYEEDINYNKKSRRFRHLSKFRNAEKRNKRKVDVLRKQFNKVVGWEENFIWKENKELI